MVGYFTPKPCSFARTQVAQRKCRNYAVRFGLNVEANADRFFAASAQAANNNRSHYPRALNQEAPHNCQKRNHPPHA